MRIVSSCHPSTWKWNWYTDWQILEIVIRICLWVLRLLEFFELHCIQLSQILVIVNQLMQDFSYTLIWEIVYNTYFLSVAKLTHYLKFELFFNCFSSKRISCCCIWRCTWQCNLWLKCKFQLVHPKLENKRLLFLYKPIFDVYLHGRLFRKGRFTKIVEYVVKIDWFCCFTEQAANLNYWLNEFETWLVTQTNTHWMMDGW